jgi:hypothetical protein
VIQIHGLEVMLDHGVRVSFQRYPEDAFSTHGRPPHSWGALPVAPRGADELLVPLAAGEALWIGLRANADVSLQASAAGSGGAARSRSFSVVDLNPDFEIGGLSIFWRTNASTNASSPIVRASQCNNPEYRRIKLSLSTEADRERHFLFHLCSYEDFSEATGLPSPAPLAEQTSYRGWLLP